MDINSSSSNWKGILFIGSGEEQKKGQVYGTPTAPDDYTVEAGETLTIPDGASLTVAAGKTMTNKGTVAISENGTGTFTNNGIIRNEGTLPASIGGNGKILSPFPNVTIASITQTTTYNGQPVTPTPTVTTTASPGASLTLDTDYTLTYADNTDAGANAKVIINPKEDKYYGEAIEETFTIGPATLNVTPNANQFHYQDEANIYPTYTYSGQVDGETPAFEGQLKWGDESDNDKIKKNNLRLIDNETGKFKASNYTLTVDETKSFTPIAENITDKKATLKASGGSQPVEGWYTADVTIKAPDDFKIRQTGVTPLRNTADWTATSFTFSQEGKHTVSYKLKRDGRDNPLAEKSLEVSLDKTAPTIGQPQKGADGKSFTLELADAYSGIATIAYNLNNAGEVSHTGFTKGDKSYTLTLASLEYGAQSIAITVTDVAGHSTTETRSIDLPKPEDPKPPVVDPEPEPEPPVIDPTPVYYTVTLPSVEGATTNPEAGGYEVKAWSSFRFYLLLDDDYNQSAPVVTTDRGETIIPRNGEYILPNVRQDVEIFINDIVKNPDPVGNEVIEATSPKVWAENKRLHIQAATQGIGYVYSADGRLLLTCNLNIGEEYSAGLPGGIYFVVIGNERFRVVL